MTSYRSLLAASLLLVGAGGAYWWYAANALQAEGDLAQSPLNSVVTVPPSFVMAVDDSGSMTFQTLFPGRDGTAFWSIAGEDDGGAGKGNGFFTGSNASARLRTQNDSFDVDDFQYVLPQRNAYLQTDFRNIGRGAIPPFDKYGFARSSEFNPAYFNPDVTYARWKRPNAAQEIVDFPDSDPKAASSDPNDVNAAKYDLSGMLFAFDPANSYREYFMVPQGMTIPAGTEYYLARANNINNNVNNCGGLTSRTAIPNTLDKVPAGGLRMTRSCYVALKYRPAVYFSTSDKAGVASGYTATPLKVDNACGKGCALYKYEIVSGNYAAAADYQKAITNFANWFSYYGNRSRAMKAALTLSLESVTKMNVGMFTINSYTGDVTNPTYANVAMRDMNSSADKKALYEESLLTLGANGGTPNRWAVRHLGRQFRRTDDAAPVKSACQINAGMLFTDGYSNSDGPGLDTGLLGDGNMPAPLKDSFNNTLADTAAAYYQTNLRPDMAQGKVPVPDACKTTPDDPRLDCNKNPHMNFYGVTLGAKGNLYRNTYDPKTNTPDPYVTFPAWEARQNDNPSTVDEIWHATMNARGKFINATTPADITNAMREILASVGGGATPSGSLGLTGARVGANTFSVTPSYEIANNGTDWFSKLNADKANFDQVSGKVTFTAMWEASALLEGASRNIRYGALAAGTVKPTLKDFQATNLGATDAAALAALCSDSLQTCSGKFNRIDNGNGIPAAAAVAYLRGSRTDDGKRLRKRTTLLGDIVNSTPVLSAKGDDYGYRGLRTSAGGLDRFNYAAYLKSKVDANRKPFVYVGANDGMLHAFDGTDGREAFGYIPSTALGHMGNLLFPYNAADRNNQIFTHRYFVDGKITVSDAYDGGNWKTVLVGSVGAGGRGVFGMDVSAQTTLNVLWEITDKSGAANGGNDIGSVLGKAAIVPVIDAGGTVKWKAIFGNGYNSVNGKAVLFVVDMMDGSVKTITAEETGANKPTRAKNGLGNVVVIDRYQGTTGATVRDGYADTVYAGDLNGAVWKFDLRNNSVAFNGAPLFIARSQDDYNKRQPIIGGFEATTVRNNVMIYFGTGSFAFNNDPTNKDMQSIYGIIDNGTVVDGRSKLRQQFISAESNGSRMISNSRLAAAQRGWFVDLGVDTSGSGNPVATGERMIGYPRLQSGILFVPTYDPSSTDACATDGNNWLYGLGAVDGSAGLDYATIDGPNGTKLAAGTGAEKLKSSTSTPITAPVTEVGVMAMDKISYVSDTATGKDIEDAKNSRCSFMAQASGSRPYYLPRPCGRQSWRQIR